MHFIYFYITLYLTKVYWLFCKVHLEFDIGWFGENLDSARVPQIEEVFWEKIGV